MPKQPKKPAPIRHRTPRSKPEQGNLSFRRRHRLGLIGLMRFGSGISVERTALLHAMERFERRHGRLKGEERLKIKRVLTKFLAWESRRKEGLNPVRQKQIWGSLMEELVGAFHNPEEAADFIQLWRKT